MDNINNNPTNLELLRLATELAYSDYNNKRANIHNQWLADNDKMRRMYGTTVPYPTIPPYPTEEEIIFKAKKLVQFLNMSRPDLEKQKLYNNINQSITDVKEENYKQSIIDQPVDTIQHNDISTHMIEGAVAPVESQESNEKTSVFEKIKNAWR